MKTIEFHSPSPPLFLKSSIKYSRYTFEMLFIVIVVWVFEFLKYYSVKYETIEINLNLNSQQGIVPHFLSNIWYFRNFLNFRNKTKSPLHVLQLVIIGGEGKGCDGYFLCNDYSYRKTFVEVLINKSAVLNSLRTNSQTRCSACAGRVYVMCSIFG